MRSTLRKGFTLIELLTVMAISAVLLTLVVVPVFQSFNLTRQAQALANAQDLARTLTERISREIADAVSVRGGGGKIESSLNKVTVQLPTTSLVIRVPRVTATGAVLTPRQDVEIALPNTRLDIMVPAEGTIEKGPGGKIVLRNPVNGKIDPTMVSPRGQKIVPVGTGQRMVRYFVGLRDPFTRYTNPYDGFLTERSAERDNLFVLYRTEVDLQVLNDLGTSWIPNEELFDTDADTGKLILDDPRFFLPDVDADGNAIRTGPKADRINAWKKKSVIVTEISRYDMILPEFDKQSRLVKNNNGVPNILPLIQFRPTHVGSEPARGMAAVRLGEETSNNANAAPDVYATRLPSWTNATVRLWPVGWNPSDTASNEYLVARLDPKNGQVNQPKGYSEYVYDPDVSPDDFLSGAEVFDMEMYERALASGGTLKYPFTQAVLAANSRSSFLNDPKLRALFRPFVINMAKGTIITSFNVSEVGDLAATPANGDVNNLPFADTGDATTPKTDANASGDALTDNKINGRFNKVYNMWQSRTDALSMGIKGLSASRIQRFLYLKATPMADQSPSPLSIFNASIVPGSEEVFGPDQVPGPNYGQEVRYVRVSGGPDAAIGLNQYRINYNDVQEPTNAAGDIDYTQIGLSTTALAGFDPDTYDASNFVSAVIQPQFKAGYIQFNSNPNDPLPTGEIRVAYRFQFTSARSGLAAKKPGGKEDVIAVDYDSRDLISVLLTVRNYPQSSLPNPQTVTLAATAHVRNTIR